MPCPILRAIGEGWAATNLHRAVFFAGFAPRGNLLSVQASLLGAWSNSYDNLNRLAGVSAAGGYFGGLKTAFTYDPFGNRIAMITGPCPGTDRPQRPPPRPLALQ